MPSTTRSNNRQFRQPGAAPRSIWLPAIVLALAIVMNACEPAQVESIIGLNAVRGTVTDFEGGALPGVAVQVEGSDYADQTDALGEYRIRGKLRGEIVLRYAKTGYTSVRQGVSVGEPDGADTLADPVSLWRLPPDSGVYLFEDYRYRPLGAVEPERYVAGEDTFFYGFDLAHKVVTCGPDATIMCYRRPRYDLEVCRMSEREADMPGTSSTKLTVWTPLHVLPSQARIIDEGTGDHLFEVVYEKPLEPGRYALHWGALEGYTKTEERAFIFDVVAPPEESAEDGESEEPSEEAEEEQPQDEEAGERSDSGPEPDAEEY